MADPGRDDAGVAGLDIDLDAVIAAEADPRPAGDAGQHLMPARMEMPVRQDVGDPGALPAILAEQCAGRRAVARFARQPSAPEHQRQPAVRNAAIGIEVEQLGAGAF